MKRIRYNYVLPLSLLLTCTPLLHSSQSDRIKIVCTSAQKPEGYEDRKKQYIRGLSLLRQHGLDAYLVESIANGPTYLDEYCDHVCYTHSNNARLRNYGINEAKSLLIAFSQFNFDPDTMIIKLTGRYPLESDEFVRLVEQNLDADVIARTWDPGDTCTGLFAIKLNLFLDFLNSIDYRIMEARNIPLEHFFGAYITRIEKEGAKIVRLAKMYSYIPIPEKFLSHR